MKINLIPMLNELIKEEFTPIKSNIIRKVEYSYFIKDNERITERIMIWFFPTVSFGYLQVEYIAYDAAKIFSALKESESIGKFWYKEIKDKFQYKVIRKKV